MKKMHPQLKLLLRLCVVFAGVVVISCVNINDMPAELDVSATVTEGYVPLALADQDGESNVIENIGQLSEFEEVILGEGQTSSIEPTAGLAEGEEDALLSDEDLEACDSNGKTRDELDIEEVIGENDDKPAIGDALDEPEKEDGIEGDDYFNSLLVTSPNYYNAEVVQGAILPIDDNDSRYEYITGSGYKAYTVSDMPEGFRGEVRAAEHMVSFDVPVWKMDSQGNKYPDTWEISIHERLADSVKCIFSDIFLLDIKFPFNYLKGFMYRKVGGSGLKNSKLMSAHSFGVAIDINYWDNDNDYYLGKGNDLRDKTNPYCIPDEVIEIFERYGWFWGGNFEICSDTMHFQYFGLEFLQYDSEEPFPILYLGKKKMNSLYIENLAKRLKRLGFVEQVEKEFTEELDEAVKAFQEAYGLEPTGKVNYATWEPLINATHDMSYVF